MSNYVWIKPVSAVRNLWRPLAETIYRQKKMKPLLIVASEQDREFYLGQRGDWSCDIEVVVQPSLYEISMTEKRSDMGDLLEQATELERTYGISLWRDFLQQDRHLGRGMVWGWNGMPKSGASEKSTFTGKVLTCIESFKFYEDLLSIYPPALVLGFQLGSGIAAKPLPLICRKNKIFYRSLSSSRLGSGYYWAVDEYNNSPDLEKAIISSEKSCSSLSNSMKVEVEPSVIYQYFSNKGGNRHSLIRACRLATFQALRGVYSRIKGYKKSRFGYYTSSSVASIFYQWWAHRRSSRRPFIKMQDLPTERPLVLFPLQFEFEASLYGESPESNSLLFAIYETATSLPLGSILVVKEHPLQPGRRPTAFYNLILRLPNVVLLCPQANSQEVLKKCAAVVQINSSLGYEAIVQGIPVYSFSRHGPIRASSINTQIRKSEDLFALRKQLLRTDSEKMIKKRKALGFAYSSAAEKYCFRIPELEKIDDGSFLFSDLNEMVEALP